MLYKDSGADSELDDIGQTPWVMLTYFGRIRTRQSRRGRTAKREDYSFILDELIR